MKKRIPLTFVLAQAVAGATYGATIYSNGTGGGSWSSTGTWSLSTVPTNANVYIQAGDAVTATGVTFVDGGNTPTVLGTLVIGTGTTMTGVQTMNYSTSSSGTLDINGGTLGIKNIGPTGGGFTVNVNSGSLSVQQNVSNSTVNVYGGTYTEGYNGSAVNILGGTFICATPTVSSWTSGTYVTNTESFSSFYTSQFSSLLNKPNNPDVLDISNNLSTAQTLSTTSSFGLTGGVVQINVYSTTSADQIKSTTVNNTFTSGVTLDIDSMGNLPAGTYAGATYQLFSNASSYTNVNPTIPSEVWEIGGSYYNVTFDPVSNGSVTVASVSLVPEPASLGLLAAAPFLLLRRRRNRRVFTAA